MAIHGFVEDEVLPRRLDIDEDEEHIIVDFYFHLSCRFFCRDINIGIVAVNSIRLAK